MKWNPFKRGGDKAAPAAPSSGLGPGVSGPAGTGEGKPAPKRGLLGRMFGRKPKPAPKPKPKPAPEEPAPKPAPEEPEAGGPPSAGEPGPGGGGEGGPAEGGGGPERIYPRTLFVSATGWWQFSKRRWFGTAHGTLTGSAVKIYLDSLEAGELNTCLYLIAEAYDDGSDFARNVIIERSDVVIDS